ncbi:MAG TPA: glycosyltransferase [Candidatus Saccharimonadales bacterium]|nr:glycosyltransferase [Candidatus Saccharimonadales bacterium]
MNVLSSIDKAAAAVEGTAVSPGVPAQGCVASPPGRPSHSGNRGPRVLYIVDSLNIGGTETQMAEAAIRLRAIGHDITVACLQGGGPLLGTLQRAGVPVVEFPKGKSLLSMNGMRQLVRLVLFLRRGKFQVVHAHDLWSNLLGVPAARLARTPVVISSRRYLADLEWYRPWKNRIVRGLYRLSTCVVVNSESVRNLLLDRDRIPWQKIRVVYNAVDFEHIAGIRSQRRELLPTIAYGAIPIAVVANMYSPVKGHAHLIAAAVKVCRSQPETVFVLIGDGPERRALEKQVRVKNLERHFLFLGRRTDVLELLACCSLAVLPSEAEALPNALLEAMSAGLPVVATCVGGIPEVIDHAVHGLLVPAQNPDSLAAAILNVLDCPHLAMELARAAQERMRTRFSFDRLMTELQQLYGCTPAEGRLAWSGGVPVTRSTVMPETSQEKAIHAL